MSKIDDLIEKLCPNGVEYKPIWSLTAWDKKFNGVDKEKQKNVISYKYYLSTDFAKVEKKNGNIKYISTGISGDDRYTTEELAGDYLAEGEVVCIPWGGTPNVKYHKGKFVTGDNRIATSLDINILSNKFLYYWMQSKINVISKFYRGSGIKHPSMKDVLDMNIAVPPLEVQCEIVHILDDFTLLSAELSAELKARQKQYEYYKEVLLENNEAKKIKLNSCLLNVENIKWKQTNENYVYIDLSSVDRERHRIINTNEINKTNAPSRAQQIVKTDDILFGGTRPMLKRSCIVENKFNNGICSTGFCVLRANRKIVNPKWIYFMISTNNFYNYVEQNQKGASYPAISDCIVKEYMITLPSLEEQEKIINLLDKFETYINDISEGLPAEIEARKKQYEYYRDKLLAFEEEKNNG